MAQNICALIVPDSVTLPGEMVHFKENRAFIIPIEPELYEDWWGSVSIFIAHVFNSADLITALNTASEVYDKYHDDDDEGPFPYDFSALASLIKSISPDSFVLTYYEDFADLTVHELFLTVIDGNVVKEGSCYYDGEFELNPEFGVGRANHGLLIQGARIGWLNQNKYRSYASAKREFESGGG